MTDALEGLKVFGPAFLDAWYVVDEQDRVIEFNAAFHAMFPRSVGRTLKSMGCRDVAKLPACATDPCLRQRCSAQGAVRLDEIDAEVGGQAVRLIVSAVPIALGEGRVGALIVLRNVTDDARVQERYQQMVEGARQEKRDLEMRLQARTRDLLAANTELNRLERELAKLRRGGA
jgi:hypothetical protein